MSICCFYQVVIFQVVLITLVRCAFLRNHVAHFCTVMLGIFAYYDSAILRSMWNLEQNTAGLGNPLRIRSTSCAFSSSVKERVMLEMLHPKSFARLESG